MPWRVGVSLTSTSWNRQLLTLRHTLYKSVNWLRKPYTGKRNSKLLIVYDRYSTQHYLVYPIFGKTHLSDLTDVHIFSTVYHIKWDAIATTILPTRNCWKLNIASPILPHWENYISISFHIQWDMIVVTVFLSILNQMEFPLVQNEKENSHHDHIPSNLRGKGIIVFSVSDSRGKLFQCVWSVRVIRDDQLPSLIRDGQLPSLIRDGQLPSLIRDGQLPSLNCEE